MIASTTICCQLILIYDYACAVQCQIRMQYVCLCVHQRQLMRKPIVEVKCVLCMSLLLGRRCSIAMQSCNHYGTVNQLGNSKCKGKTDTYVEQFRRVSQRVYNMRCCAYRPSPLLAIMQLDVYLVIYLAILIETIDTSCVCHK